MAARADEPRIVVTGLGLVLPHGAGTVAVEDVFAGRSAVRRLPAIPGLPDATGAAVTDFTPLAGTERADRAVQFAVSAAAQAWAASRLAASGVDPHHVATLVSLSKGCLGVMARLREHAAEAADLWSQTTPDAAGRAIARHLHLAGPVITPVTACASGGHALALGATLLRRGAAEAVLVGAAEASLHPLVLGSYHRMGVLAPPGDDPAASVRPFSVRRCGFAIGEGAGVLVLETEAAARRRGAEPLAEVCGWAAGSQAAGLTDMEPGGETLAHLIREALRRAGALPAAIDYINAHGTATIQNDLAEAAAIRSAFGPAAAGVSVSSTKAVHGHLLGAAAAVELVLAVLAMGRGCVPPTANLTDPDPEIGLDCTPLVARQRPIQSALKIASGFGGHMLAVVLSRPR